LRRRHEQFPKPKRRREARAQSPRSDSPENTHHAGLFTSTTCNGPRPAPDPLIHIPPAHHDRSDHHTAGTRRTKARFQPRRAEGGTRRGALGFSETRVLSVFLSTSSYNPLSDERAARDERHEAKLKRPPSPQGKRPALPAGVAKGPHRLRAPGKECRLRGQRATRHGSFPSAMMQSRSLCKTRPPLIKPNKSASHRPIHPPPAPRPEDINPGGFPPRRRLSVQTADQSATKTLADRLAGRFG